MALARLSRFLTLLELGQWPWRAIVHGMSSFKKATKEQAKLRLALQGPSGSGKTRSALEIARHMGKSVAVIDSEHGSAAKYAGLGGLEFDVCQVTDNYHPERLIKLLREAAESYDVVIVDSMTHWWNGPGGFLELVDQEVANMKARGGRADSHAAWKAVDKIYKELVRTILSVPTHVIVTMRAKMDYVKEQDERGKTTVKKVGLAPEMRDNFQYELDIEGMINMDHQLVIGKNRCDGLDGKIFSKPGKDFADIVLAWLEDGAPAAPAPPPPDWESLKSQSLQFLSSVTTAEALKAFREGLATTFPAGTCPDNIRKEIGAALTRHARELQAKG